MLSEGRIARVEGSCSFLIDSVRWFVTGQTRKKRDSLSDSCSDIIDLEEGILVTPLSKKQNCNTRYNNNISNTNVFTVETDV